MSGRDLAVGLLARAAAFLLRLMIRLPAGLSSRFFGAASWVIWVLTGNRVAAQPAAELSQALVAGPQFADNLKQMMSTMEPNMIASIVRCLSRRSPYGAP